MQRPIKLVLRTINLKNPVSRDRRQPKMTQLHSETGFLRPDYKS
ncbi:MAG: hypothetical protein U7126_17160 [Microcoleus sp.]|jgi:hypothetical protein